jgi:hypothetical protein
VIAKTTTVHTCLLKQLQIFLGQRLQVELFLVLLVGKSRDEDGGRQPHLRDIQGVDEIV